jgi:hypothetical protein
MARAGLSVLGSGYSGKAGSVVFARYRNGTTQIRQRTAPMGRTTQAQREARELVRWANVCFRDLGPEELQAWKRYAERLADMAWAERRPCQVNVANAYRSLAIKFVQVNGRAEPPQTPPAAPFAGDGVLVSAAAVPGGIEFTASGPNSSGVVTELLLHPLRLAVSTPDPAKYRHRGFVTFAPGSLTAFVAAPRGWVSPAVRFVLAATGQCSAPLSLGPLRVD